MLIFHGVLSPQKKGSEQIAPEKSMLGRWIISLCGPGIYFSGDIMFILGGVHIAKTLQFDLPKTAGPQHLPTIHLSAERSWISGRGSYYKPMICIYIYIFHLSNSNKTLTWLSYIYIYINTDWDPDITWLLEKKRHTSVAFNLRYINDLLCHCSSQNISTLW